MASFMGARLENGQDTVWFSPEKLQEIKDIEFKYDPNNVWLKRVKDIKQTAMKRWQENVQVGMTDLGASLDIIFTFRPGEKLLLDLYDHHDQVKHLLWQVHEMWFRYFDDFNSIFKPGNPDYTAWTPIFSEETYYMLQCDFCYMISPQMFDEFVKPELVASCKHLANPFYHLDGPGQLPHLDSLLQIEELKGVQWVPGDGSPPISQWPEVYSKIRKSGKLIRMFAGQDPAGFRVLDTITDQLGSAEGIVLIGDADISQEKEVEAFLAKYY